jgi:hypothetical protein
MPDLLKLAASCGASLVFGVTVALLYMAKNRYSKGFVVVLALLPAMVSTVIMAVNGSIGAGVAVAGAFSLVRFRSLPGDARDIGTIFFAMSAGLVSGMGQLELAFAYVAVISAVYLALIHTSFGEPKSGRRTLKVTVPETYDYEGLFDPVFREYADYAALERVKTANMGSLFELTYTIQLKPSGVPKAFIDEIRTRNGNLSVTVSREAEEGEKL